MTSNSPDSVLAHGLAVSRDLPIPFAAAVVGGGLALVASFVLAVTLWRRPRLWPNEGGFPVPWAQRVIGSRIARACLLAMGALCALTLALITIVSDDEFQKPAVFTVLFTLIWVGLLPLSVLFGPFWRFVNPLRAVHAVLAWVTRTDPAVGRAALPSRIGYWPAAVGLLAFAWLELAAPFTYFTFGMWFAVYTVLHLAAALVFGARWFEKGDAFEVASRCWATLSPWRWRYVKGSRTLVLGNPLRTGAGLRPAPGLAAVAVILLGVTAYDTLQPVSWWGGFVSKLGLSAPMTNTLSLLYIVGLVGLAYFIAISLIENVTSDKRTPAGEKAAPLTSEFAHSLLPIAAGYFVAHYAISFLLGAVPGLINLGGPAFAGFEWPLRSADLNRTTVASVQVGAVIVGHVLGVILAHDRSLRIFIPRDAFRSQLPLIVLMTGYTLGGLWLLFGG